ncbi:HIT domain-containing protein [Minwuia sp.]|uniref:HIT domain-containing protein n=1 Tax=Minwuia sp. TaxID=2493630 RepID=UPI003A90B9B3
MADDFEIDPRLSGSSHAVGDWPLCHVRLSDDARWPWLLLIPRRVGAVELFDLSPDDRTQLIEEAASAALIVRNLIDADKTNVATLGNQVPQMHMHVIGRKIGDAAWPGPIWGVGEPVARAGTERDSLIETIRHKTERSFIF